MTPKMLMKTMVSIASTNPKPKTGVASAPRAKLLMVMFEESHCQTELDFITSMYPTWKGWGLYGFVLTTVAAFVKDVSTL